VAGCKCKEEGGMWRDVNVKKRTIQIDEVYGKGTIV
jgi:hypothetical protein